MKILVTGSTGFIGSALVPFLAEQGHEVTRLVRREVAAGGREASWDPVAGTIDEAALAGIDAVIHLAGHNIAAGRWTDRRKALIRDSRVKGTRLLSEALARLDPPPRVLVCATGKDFYGDRADEVLREDSSHGAGFLADVVRQMEAATEPASSAGVRVVKLRIGLVLRPAGGALKRMLPVFKLGLGGKLGSGNQYWPWISMDDLLGTIDHALAIQSLEGAVNTCAPSVPTNAEFTKALGRALSRPTLFFVPPLALRILFGEVSEALLSGQRMDSSKLQASGFEFHHRDLQAALRDMFGRA
jgi:uncharacterized protein (TIGR01777 family)